MTSAHPKRNNCTSPKPFLKWAGGKGSLLQSLCGLVPKQYERYIEPFVGGGALFFELQPRTSILADLNQDLINCYRIVRDNCDELIGLLDKMPISKDFFYALRSKSISEMSPVERAARMIYLNKTCFNGLYRVNKKGHFNAPFGHYRKVNLYNARNIKMVSDALKKTRILEGDFETILLKNADKDDLIYLDPPYPPIGRYSDFKRYTKEFFESTDHARLAKVVGELDRRGSKFILSNPKHDIVEEFYSNFRKIDVEAPRFINCQGSRRGNVPEVLVTNIR